MLLDRLAVDQRAVGAAEVFQKGVVQDGHDNGVLTADREIVDLNVVVRFAADGRALFAERELLDQLTIETQYQLRHPLFEPGKELRKQALVGREVLPHLDQHHRDIIAPAVVVRHLHQLVGCELQVGAQRF